ncbi:hypothetical protein SLA2020_353600 [Shorea laevis]
MVSSGVSVLKSFRFLVPVMKNRMDIFVEFFCKTFEGREDDDLGTSKFWWLWSIFKGKDVIVKAERD